MEPDKIALETVHRVIHVLLGHRRVDHKVRWKRRSRWIIRERGSDGGVIEWEKRKVPPDMVRDRIRPDYVFEPASGDLIIVGGVTPTTNADTRIIEEFGVVKVGRV